MSIQPSVQATLVLQCVECAKDCTIEVILDLGTPNRITQQLCPQCYYEHTGETDEGMAEFYAEYDSEILTCVSVCARCEMKFEYLEKRGRLHEGGPDLCKSCIEGTEHDEVEEVAHVRSPFTADLDSVAPRSFEGWKSIDTSLAKCDGTSTCGCDACFNPDDMPF